MTAADPEALSESKQHLAAAFRCVCAERPYEPALVCGDEVLNFSELGNLVDTTAQTLQQLGVARGDRVAVLLTNCSEHVETVLAIAALGAIWVPLNYRLTAHELSFVIQDSEAKALVCETRFAQEASELLALNVVDEGRLLLVTPSAGARPPTTTGSGSTCRPRHTEAVTGQQADKASTPLPLSDDDIFTIAYTSGTTGRPKGVVLTHRQFVTGARYLAQAVDARPVDRLLEALPQFHAGGATYQFAFLLAGAAVVVLPHFTPASLVETARKTGATVAGMVPTMLHDLTGWLEGEGEGEGASVAALPSLRAVMYGGASIGEPQLRAALQRLPVDYYQTYGLTELGVICSILGPEDHRRGYAAPQTRLLSSCGRSIPGYQMRLVDVDVQSGIGEIAVRSRSVMSCYWKRREATAQALQDGWVLTGDLAAQDADGYFFLVDRRSNLIITGAENVYPSEVEAALAGHPGVTEVSVIGIPDARLGEIVCACVVLHVGAPTPTVEDLRQYCTGRLARYKHPRMVCVVDHIPRNPSGKVLRRELLALVGRGAR